MRLGAGGVAGGTSGYDAFISYSHALDGALARALQTGLERFAKPWFRPRALRVFRDTASLSANPGLWSSIENALASSAWLVLMASPDAARSPWVDREVAWWLENKSPQRLLVVLTEGELAFDQDGGHGDEATAALPPALHRAFAEEPRWVDLRWLRDMDQVDQSNPRLRECVADVAAAVREVPKDVLVGEHIRQHRRTMRFARGGVTALVLLLIAALVAAVIAVGQRNQARELARIATARQLVVQAEATRNTDPRTALLLGIAAERIHPDGQTHSSLVTSLTDTRYAGTLTGHTSNVEATTFAPGGHTMATGGNDGKVILWDITGPNQPRPLGQPLTSDVELVGLRKFSPDGRSLATVRSDGTVVLWDVTDLTRPRTLGKLLTSNSKFVGRLEFSGDGRTLAIGSSDPGTVILWDITNPTHARQFGQPLSHGRFLELVAFFPDGRTLATSSSNDDFKNTMILWDLTDAVQPRSLGQPLGYDGSVAFSPQTRLLATETGAAFDDTVDLWDLTDPSQPRRLDLTRTLTGPSSQVDLMEFSPDGHTLATVGGKMVRLWDLTDPAQPRPLGEETTQWGSVAIPGPLAHSETVHSVAFFPDRRTVATVSGENSEDRIVILWDLTDPAKPRQIGQPITGASRQWKTVAFFPDGRTVATGRADGTLTLWDTTDQSAPRLLGQPLTGTSPVVSVAFFPDAHTLAIGRSDGSVELRDFADPAKVGPPSRLVPPASQSGTGVVFAGQRGLLAFHDVDGTAVTVMDFREPTRGGRIVKPFFPGKGGEGVPRVLGFSPDGRILAVGVSSWGSYVTLWDVSDPAHPRGVGPPLEPLDFFSLVAFSPDGRVVASRVGAGSPPGVNLIDIGDPARPEPIGDPLAGHTDWVRAVAFSPDGRMLATGSADRTVILWDIADLTQPRRLGLPLTGHNSDVVSLAFSPDGRTLATGGGDGEVILWDLAEPANARHLGLPLTGRNSNVASLAFSPDGRTLATGGEDGAILLWDVTRLSDLRGLATERACAKTGRGLDRDEWARYIPGLAYQNTCPG